MTAITKSSAMKISTPLPRVVWVVLGSASWGLLILAALLTAFLLGWVMLGVVLIGSGPCSGPTAPPVLPILAGLLVITLGLAWLSVRFAASWRQVGRAIAVIFVLLAIVETTWALSAPDQALYFARNMTWGGPTVGGVRDSQTFPQRTIQNGPSAYHFPQNPSPQLFRTIQYVQAGQLKQASLSDFLTATQSTSFIVIQNGTILDESYANGYSRDSINTSFSVAKSITSALIGIAIREGYIGSVHDRMVSYLPELRGKGLDDVTLRDLLMMSAGLKFVHQDTQPPLVNMLALSDDSHTT